MANAQKELLEKYLKVLVTNLDIETVTRYLASEGILNFDDRDCTSSKKVLSEKNDALIGLLKKNDPQAFSKFVEVLEKLQPSLACKLLREVLEAKETEIKELKQQLKLAQDTITKLDGRQGRLIPGNENIAEGECIQATSTANEEAMDERCKKILKSVMVELVNDMDAEEVLLHMAKALVFSERDEERIKSKSTRREQCTALLEILSMRGAQAYSAFIKALEEVHPHLANIVRKAESVN